MFSCSTLRLFGGGNIATPIGLVSHLRLSPERSSKTMVGIGTPRRQRNMALPMLPSYGPPLSRHISDAKTVPEE